jgi:hypothetical protein
MRDLIERAKPAKFAIPVFCILLTLACGGREDAPRGIGEHTDYYDGVTYHRYFRYSGLNLGYATSLDGIHFDSYPGNPIMEDAAYPVLAQDGSDMYLIVRQHSTGKYFLYDVSVPTSPALANDGKPILAGDYCNVAAVVVEGKWHMLVEGHDSDYFFLMYTWADFPDLDFNANLGPAVIPDAGNPTMCYIPGRGAILALYGADYRATGLWRVRAATFDFNTWTVRDFVLSKAGVHIADPDLGIGVESSPLILTAGSNQDSISTYYFRGSKLDLYDAMVAGQVELEETTGNPTMTAD